MTKRQTKSVALLVGGFETFLASYDRDCPFKRHGQLQYHVETIRTRRQLGSAKAALADEAFQRALYRTLQAWGIGPARQLCARFRSSSRLFKPKLGQSRNWTTLPSISPASM